MDVLPVSSNRPRRGRPPKQKVVSLHGGSPADFAAVDDHIEGALSNLLRATDEVITRAESIDALVTRVVHEQARLRQEVGEVRKERESIIAYVNEMKASAAQQADVVLGQAHEKARQMIAAAESERDRALEGARALEARIASTEKCARVLLSELFPGVELGQAEIPPAPRPVGRPRKTPLVPTPAPMNPAPSSINRAEMELAERVAKARAAMAAAQTAPETKRAEPVVPPVLTVPVPDPIDSLPIAPAAPAPIAPDRVEQVTRPEPAVAKDPVSADAGQFEPISLVKMPKPAAKSVGTDFQIEFHPVRSFGGIESIERQVTQVKGVESFRVVNWNAQTATAVLNCSLDGDDLFGVLVRGLSGARVQRVNDTEFEVELPS